MSQIPILVVAALAVLQTVPALAKDFSDPTWPCIQRKVDQLSLGLMWPYPVPEAQLAPELKPGADELVDTLVLRRVSMDEAEALVADFDRANPELTVEDHGLIFKAVFDDINHDRSRLIEGISRYSLHQIEAAARIEATRQAIDAEMAKDEPDYDRADALEEQLHWDERIYQDRAQSLIYVCETPVLLEKRAYAIAQALSRVVNN
ncbi:hypothetical protein [Hoeflea ulvae]|uniref:Uncharacterized protein n=1 Tax=Hoeflea ulvae TaxID=2983764 RepID=A0ABT3YLL5_9HYPH|nr:hypothetical protein [Hoeflea ulvae]MCY0096482.1 hypothetical protein [Hoeflea ulvae]